MNLTKLVWNEIRERPMAMAASVAAILLGVAALVSVRHITDASEADIARQLAKLGANVLILPKGASVEDYYAADQNGRTIPEEYAGSVLLANLTGVEKLSPKLCVPAEVNAQKLTVTGILPQSEFEAQAAWKTVGMFTKKKHVGCKRASCGAEPQDKTPEALIRQRTIATLGKREVILGADAAQRTGLKPGAAAKIFDETFEVVAVLPATGTVDDDRVFAHLHEVQELTNSGTSVSAIEVMACCEDAAGDLVAQLESLLPDTKIVTINRVVETQVGVNRMLGSVSLFVLVVLVIVGGLSVAGTIASNVRERRREIGTLMALGASPGFVARLFVLKGLAVGLIGGVLGTAIGVAVALLCGPQLAGVTVAPLPTLIVFAVGMSIVVSLAAAWWPARGASRLDPCCCFQET
jgi:putative ABC transport system permease protein